MTPQHRLPESGESVSRTAGEALPKDSQTSVRFASRPTIFAGRSSRSAVCRHPERDDESLRTRGRHSGAEEYGSDLYQPGIVLFHDRWMYVACLNTIAATGPSGDETS